MARLEDYRRISPSERDRMKQRTWAERLQHECEWVLIMDRQFRRLQELRAEEVSIRELLAKVERERAERKKL